MTDLTRLKVSLTKHNAHKVAQLLKDYPITQVLGHLDEVHAEQAQAYKNLSVQPDGSLPNLWADAQKLGPDGIDALVFLAIIFSHHQLIEALREADTRKGPAGTVKRGKVIGEKAYTNFARIVDQLGFATSLEYEGVSFDLSSLLDLPGLGPLAGRLFEKKLRTAGWSGAGTVSREAVRAKFHEALGLSAIEFSRWLTTGARPSVVDPGLLPKDKAFFDSDDEPKKKREFNFRAGHIERGVAPLLKSASRKSKADRLHNDLQNRLFAHLAQKLGAKKVGTEVDTGYGTSIDLVTKVGENLTFYEIKTCEAVRTSIRQALPQLLEYAHWPRDRRANRLIVVSHLPLTADGRHYLQFLRDTYGLPIEYRQFDIKAGVLR